MPTTEIPDHTTPRRKRAKKSPPPPAAAAAGSLQSRKEKRPLRESFDDPVHISSDRRPSSRDHDANPRPIPVISLTYGEDESSSNAAAVHHPGSTILFGHPRPSPGRATVTVLVTNTDEHGFTTSSTSTSETAPRTVSTDWLDRPFAVPPRKLVAQTQHGCQPFPNHHAPVPVNGQQFCQNNPPPTTAAYPFMPPHNNKAPFAGNQAPAQFVNTAPGPAPFQSNHGPSNFHPAYPTHTQTFHPQPSWNTHPMANHPQQNPAPIRMVPAPIARFHPYNQAPPHRVHASDAPPPPDFRVVDSAPICFDPYSEDASGCVQAGEVSFLQQ